ncbi:MAG: heterodisulfide reductase subunit B [Thaumarchaeota archaeon]|nr:heterodisulfide reductase subunit B [Nitrososphaerota archaeon]
MKYAYYPGCSAHTSGKEYDKSFRLIAKALDIELVDVPDWTCCGSHVTYVFNPTLAASLSTRNLALVEKMGEGIEVVTICSGCYQTLKRSNELLKHDANIQAKVKEALEAVNLSYNANVKIHHALETLTTQEALDTISKRITKPLKGLKVAPYYGCAVVRPKFEDSFDDPENPQSLDRLLNVLGAEPVPYIDKVRCCGGVLIMKQERVCLEMIRRLLVNAKQAGAECMVTPCALCHLNLDIMQPKVEQAFKQRFNMPVFFFTQLIGLALGLKPTELGLDKHMVPPISLLRSKAVEV